MADACIYCGEPATKLCDFVLGFQIHSTIPHKTMSSDAMWTCDAPTCDRHASRKGFVCGKSPDTIDYCQMHAAAKERQGDELCITAADADVLRREAHIAIRRSALRLTDRLPV